MSFVKALSKYIIIVIIGILLAFLVARIEYDTQDLSASVLSLTEQDFFQSTKWDAGYKKENQNFEVFLAEQVRNEGELTISILYSLNDIQRFTDQIETNYSVDVVENSEGNLILNVSGYGNGDFSRGIFELPYSGDFRDITLEYIKSENLNFSIGNLDIIEKNQSH